jgi:hypothetical protein
MAHADALGHSAPGDRREERDLGAVDQQRGFVAQPLVLRAAHRPVARQQLGMPRAAGGQASRSAPRLLPAGISIACCAPSASRSDAK